jgi:hypothetical protein
MSGNRGISERPAQFVYVGKSTLKHNRPLLNSLQQDGERFWISFSKFTNATAAD